MLPDVRNRFALLIIPLFLLLYSILLPNLSISGLFMLPGPGKLFNDYMHISLFNIFVRDLIEKLGDFCMHNSSFIS
jgi:hypothetical protein